jgi:hypothetical protein
VGFSAADVVEYHDTKLAASVSLMQLNKASVEVEKAWLTRPWRVAGVLPKHFGRGRICEAIDSLSY